MRRTAWWKAWIIRSIRRRDEQARLRAAHQFGHQLARCWLAGRGSAIRALTPGAEDSLVAAAFRHGLLEGSDLRDAAEVAHSVLSGMTDAARTRSRNPRGGSRSLETSRRAAALRGVASMAEQVLLDAASDYKLDRATIDKIRGWSLDHPFTNRPAFPQSASGRSFSAKST